MKILSATLFLSLGLGLPVISDEVEDVFAMKRETMVRQTIEMRDITDPLTLKAMRAVERHRFVLPELIPDAYDDRPLPIGYGQTISQPYIVAIMTQLLQVNEESIALEIGAGSGYQAAVLAEIVKKVYTIEIVPELAELSSNRLRDLGYENAVVKEGDGYFGWEEHGPYDAIIVTAASSHIPPPLIEQLKPGGRLVIPVGPPMQVQNLMLVEKNEDGSISQRSLMPVRFVPFTRR